LFNKPVKVDQVFRKALKTMQLNTAFLAESYWQTKQIIGLFNARNKNSVLFILDYYQNKLKAEAYWNGAKYSW
jgi:hypothetical protein